LIKFVHYFYLFMFLERVEKMNIEKKEIIERAFQHLKKVIGERLEYAQLYSDAPNKDYDAVFGFEEKAIHTVVKNEVRPNHIEQLLQLKKQLKNIIVLANYITPGAKKLMQEQALNYVDRAGNTWLRMDLVHIHIEGRPNQPLSEDVKNRAFTKTGIKVVFQFLNQPDMLHATYRQIVAATGVSLGTIPKVMAGLQAEGFLLKKNKNEWLINDYRALLNHWQVAYSRRLKPTLFAKRYRPTDAGFYTKWKNLTLSAKSHWGGEPAGDLLTHYLSPELFTLYTEETQRELMKNYRWVPDEGGDIYAFNRFWKPEESIQPTNCVPAVLAYADLMETGDSRCVETANMIYERYLQKH